MPKFMLRNKIIFTAFLVMVSLNTHAEKFNSKNLNEIKGQIESADFNKIKYLEINDRLVTLNLRNIALDLSKLLQFLSTLGYLYNEMLNKHDQVIVKETIEDYKKIYQAKCEFEEKYRYQFKIEDATLAIKVDDFYKDIIKSCDIVRKWN